MAESETFQHFQVLRKPDGTLWELGRGAMGVTYKAFDTNLRCPVALKVINAAYLDNDMARQRFLREARAAAGLSHPNVARVFHLGEEGGNYFYAMEFIEGETLGAYVRREGPLPAGPALQIALQVTGALRAAAREGLVHRDIKPANLMLLTDDEDDLPQVKVIDFGLAKTTPKDGESSLAITVAGFVGTPHYASPEQLEERELDSRSDLYSLGVTLWYMLTGRPPFAGSLMQIMSQHLSRAPAFNLLPDQAPEVIHLLEHLLEKDPARRPQTPSDLRREIEQAISALAARGAPLTRAAPKRPPPGPPPASRPPAAGDVLDGRYRLLREVAQGPHGTVFEALELDTGKPVAALALLPDLFPTDEAWQAAQHDVDRVRLAPHPNLLQIFRLERLGPHLALISEWVNGFSLLDVLRRRHALTAAETIRLLDPVAAAVDHARARGLPDLDLSPENTYLVFAPTVNLAACAKLPGEPLSAWPAFGLKLFPLALASRAAETATWSGLQTMAPLGGPAIRTAPERVALLACELLGGALPALLPGQTPRLRPLPALNELGNEILQRALAPQTPPAYACAADLARALAASMNGAETAPRPRTAPLPMLPSARRTPPAPAATSHPVSRRQALMAAVIAGFLLLLGALAYVTWKMLGE